MSLRASYVCSDAAETVPSSVVMKWGKYPAVWLT